MLPDPELNQQSIEHVDATPDKDYPLRILRAYRENCNQRWLVSGLSPQRSAVYDVMNEMQEQRARILDAAIARLSSQDHDLSDRSELKVAEPTTSTG